MIDFIKKRRLWYFISISIIFVGTIAMFNNYRNFYNVFNLGIDFTGGTSIILRFEKPVSDIELKLREILNNLSLEKHTIQTSGLSDLIIKTEEMDVQKRNDLFRDIERKISKFDI